MTGSHKGFFGRIEEKIEDKLSPQASPARVTYEAATDGHGEVLYGHSGTNRKTEHTLVESQDDFKSEQKHHPGYHAEHAALAHPDQEVPASPKKKEGFLKKIFGGVDPKTYDGPVAYGGVRGSDHEVRYGHSGTNPHNEHHVVESKDDFKSEARHPDRLEQ